MRPTHAKAGAAHAGAVTFYDGPVPIELDVVGIPAPQGSKSAFPIKDARTGKYRAVVVEGTSGVARQKVKDWRGAVSEAAVECPVHKLAEPVGIRIEFFMPVVKSDPWRTRSWVNPDLDKLLRSTLDGLVMGGLLTDDSLVCDLRASKIYAHDREPGARIQLVPLGAVEAEDRARRRTAAKAAR